MKITSLIENTSSRNDIRSEHGLSLYIETEAHKILFDMGQSDLFAENAKALEIELSEVDIAILSHGHYDHGGGLSAFLNINEKARVYINRYAFLPHYNGTEKYIGLDVSLEGNPRIVFTDDVFKVSDKLTLYSCNEKERSYGFSGQGLTEKVGESFIQDDFRHEQYLLAEEAGKRILISGCSHKGILNIVNWFHPDVLVGGFHFSKMPLNNDLANAANKLRAYKTVYYTCHCTGIEQFEFMRSKIKDLYYLSSGDSIEI